MKAMTLFSGHETFLLSVAESDVKCAAMQLGASVTFESIHMWIVT